jgi:hypothetical protein
MDMVIMSRRALLRHGSVVVAGLALPWVARGQPAKIPEGIIRETLSEVRTDGARDPARLFTYKIQRYALTKQKS